MKHKELSHSQKEALIYIKGCDIGKYLCKPIIRRKLHINNPWESIEKLIELGLIEVETFYVHMCHWCNYQNIPMNEKTIQDTDKIFCEKCNHIIENRKVFYGYKLIKVN